MPPQSERRIDAEEWLRYARANVDHAEVGRAAGVLIAYLCFDAQQAAEKALKAGLIARSVVFPRTHDLAELLDLARNAGLEVSDAVGRSATLTSFAVRGRYPGWGASLEEDDLVKALSAAQAVIDWAAKMIEAMPPE